MADIRRLDNTKCWLGHKGIIMCMLCQWECIRIISRHGIKAICTLCTSSLTHTGPEGCGGGGGSEHLGVTPGGVDGLDGVVLCHSWKQQIICTLNSMHGTLKHNAEWTSKKQKEIYNITLFAYTFIQKKDKHFAKAQTTQKIYTYPAH